MKTLYIAYPPFFQIFSTPPHPLLPCRLQLLPPMLIRLSCLFGWMSDRVTFDRLFYLMISWMYTCRALVPWCMFYATRRQVYWVLTRDVELAITWNRNFKNTEKKVALANLIVRNEFYFSPIRLRIGMGRPSVFLYISSA